MSSISIIGSGDMASALGTRAVKGGNAVEVIGRDAGRAAALANALGGGTTARPRRGSSAPPQPHAAYLAALPDHPAPGDIISKLTVMSGRAMGVEHAVLFRAHYLQAPLELFAEAMQD